MDEPTTHARAESSNLRAYLAGGGATAALVGAAIVVFVSVAAFVGFNGLPFGADDSPDATVDLVSGASEAAAVAASPAADAVAATPADPSDAALAELVAALPPGAVGSAGGGPGGVPGDPGPGPGPGPGPDDPGPPDAPAPGPLGNTVGNVEDTAGGLGLDVPLSELTNRVTKPVDDLVKDTVDGIGGLLGEPRLGEKAGGAVNGLTDGLLGPR